MPIDNSFKIPLAGKAEAERTLYLSALGLSTFTNGGYDHRMPNRFRTASKQLLNYLVEQVKADPPVVLKSEPMPESMRDAMNRFGRATKVQAAIVHALTQTYAISTDPDLRLPAQRSVDRLIQLQLASGGWGRGRAQAEGQRQGKEQAKGQAGPSDSLSTLHALRALQSAETAGLSTADSLPRVKAWFVATLAGIAQDSAWQGHWPSSSNGQSHFGESNIASDVAGLGLMTLLGHDLKLTTATALADGILARQASIGSNRPELRLLATLAIFRFGGEHKTNWNNAQRDQIIAEQHRVDGCSDGMWGERAGHSEQIKELGPWP